MPPTVESAASSTIGPCTGPVPMDGTSMACYLDRQKLRRHQSALDGRPSPNRSGLASCASSARPALMLSLMTWPEATATSCETAAEAMVWPRRPASRPLAYRHRDRPKMAGSRIANIVPKNVSRYNLRRSARPKACTTSPAKPKESSKPDELHGGNSC